jgi:hypothetical protein
MVILFQCRLRIGFSGNRGGHTKTMLVRLVIMIYCCNRIDCSNNLIHGYVGHTPMAIMVMTCNA